MLQLKVEVLIPLYYNNKTPIEDEKLLKAYDTIESRFGGCTIDETPLIGGWIDPITKIRYDDINETYWVLCDKTKANMEFFQTLKRDLEKLFEQKEILMYYVNIYRF